ncbi:HIT family protein [Acholeplasma vituli]|uniref:HIT family protein n=1 Tax=Paracholeplasma vituli TaxID=69473 RepID=A0ABT2PX17_9MOLU|nr:HIT family protein [Paracholeplasma vituli]MCU0104198.1 HIT family protein [Paracholeplasma vituli]
MDSIFTKIIKREIPAHIVYEDDLVIAFLDITQATKGHTLVVPKAQYETIFDMPEALSGKVFEVVTKVSKAVQKAFNPEGLNILSNNGSFASQSVFHFHVHIIPRYQGDDLTPMKMVNHVNELSKGDFEKRKEAIIASLS